MIVPSLLFKYWFVATYLMISVPFQSLLGVYTNILFVISADPFSGAVWIKNDSSKSCGSDPVKVIWSATSSSVDCAISSTLGALTSKTVMEFSWILKSLPPAPCTDNLTE